jgi:hypothetical protein
MRVKLQLWPATGNGQQGDLPWGILREGFLEEAAFGPKSEARK